MNPFDIKNKNKGTFYLVKIIPRDFSKFLDSYTW